MCGIDQVLTPQDRDCLRGRGMSVDAIEHQLGLFRQGIPFTVLKKPCTIEDGIERLSPRKFVSTRHG